MKHTDLSYAQGQLLRRLKRKKVKLARTKHGLTYTFGLIPFHKVSFGVYEAINSKTAAKLVEKGYVEEQVGVNTYSTTLFIPKSK
jgi:hypothetical protein